MMRFSRSIGSAHVLLAVSLFMIITLISDAEAYTWIKNRKNGVTVDVKPVQIAPGGPARFQVQMNTHSVDLSQDMVAVSTLKDDQGQEYRPVNWDGSGPGGHHRSGILEFPELKGAPKSITLIIRDIANVPERVFQWKIE